MQSATDDSTEETRTELDDPIKIRWTGYARQRIYGYNLDFDRPASDLVVGALDRQKTNVVIETVEEAGALAGELTSYIGGAGAEGRVWVNGAIDAALQRVQGDIIDGMAERGYGVKNPGSLGMAFVPEADAPDGPAVQLVDEVRERIEADGEVTLATVLGDVTVDDPANISAEGGNVRVEPGFAGDPSDMTVVAGGESR